MQHMIGCNTHFYKINCPNSQIVGNYGKHKVCIKKLTLVFEILTVGCQGKGSMTAPTKNNS